MRRKNEKIRKKKINFEDYINRYWFSENEEKVIWLYCYRIVRMKVERKEPSVIKFNGANCLILYGNIPYLNTIKAQLLTDPLNDSSKYLGYEKLQKETNLDWYLLIIIPFKENEADIEKEKRLQQYLSVIVAFNSRNIAYEKIFENQINFTKKTRSSSSPVLIVPYMFKSVELTSERIKIIEEAHKKILKLDENLKNRVTLSLSWFGQATYSFGVDAFLKYWIAIEVIAMPDSSNINTLIEILADVYEIRKEDAKKKFGVGRIFDFRSKIVHHGFLLPINPDLLKYLEAIYIDVLFKIIDIKSDKRIQEFFNNDEFELNQLLNLKSE
jgi:hypothetical protein